MYFLSGLPRSGNTLLSALLNQNPDIYSSPISPLLQNVLMLHRNCDYEANIPSQENQIRHHRSMVNYVKSFYSDIKKPIIFDREKEWGTPHNLYLMRTYVEQNPKIIVTVRNVLDVIASLINANRGLYLNEMRNIDFHCSYYLSENDAIAEYLMATGNLIDKSLLCVSSALNKEYAGMFHLVEYEDLVSNPQETMNKIYEFIGIDSFTHDFENIQKREIENDQAINLSPITHRVNKTITKSKTDARSMFSPYIIDKYSNLEFWRNPDILNR